jgi:hypothetical protein
MAGSMDAGVAARALPPVDAVLSASGAVGPVGGDGPGEISDTVAATGTRREEDHGCSQEADREEEVGQQEGDDKEGDDKEGDDKEGDDKEGSGEELSGEEHQFRERALLQAWKHRGLLPEVQIDKR